MMNVAIVNNGFYETIYNVDSGSVIHKSLVQDESEDSFSYLASHGIEYTLMSYSVY